MDDRAMLQLVYDRQEIEQVLHRYCRAIDRLDIELLRSIYWPEATDAHGTFVGNAHEFADFIMGELENVTNYGFHTITQSIIDVHGDVAASEATYIGYHRIRGGWDNISTYFGDAYAEAAKAAGTLDQEHEYEAGGRYIDRFEKRGGEWKVARRVITNEWGRIGVAGDVYAGGTLKKFNLPGARDRSDPVYANLRDVAGVSA